MKTSLLDFTEKSQYRWKRGGGRKLSCIPVTVIFFLSILVVLLPLLKHANEKSSHTITNGSSFICTDHCRIQLVESIPEGLNYSQDSPRFMSTFEAWNTLLDIAKESLDIASFYSTLRDPDFSNYASAQQGENIFQKILTDGIQKKYAIRIVQSGVGVVKSNLDTEHFVKKDAAEVRSVNLTRLIGGGVFHTKLWIVDSKHFYIGSANMDWRALTQLKELGVLVTNCSCLAKDVAKIFKAYWFLGKNNSSIPSRWPDEYSTKFNLNSPITVNYNNKFNLNTFVSSAPFALVAKGRTSDLDAIVNTILDAKKFVHICLTSYYPLIVFSPKVKFWPTIDDALRKAAIDNRVSMKLLISYEEHSHPSQDYFLKSLKSLSNAIKGVDIEVRRFIVPADADQAKIPFARTSHNKYMVTDNAAYIGTSNWSGDYFRNSTGIGFVIKEDTNISGEEDNETIRFQLASIFERDWNSQYTIDVESIN